MKYNVSGATHIGNVRSKNQDNLFFNGGFRKPEEDSCLFEGTASDEVPWITAVFDGMGGEQDGEVASLIASEVTKANCRGANNLLDPVEMVFLINDRICRESEELNCHMGSTCVFLEFSEGKCRSINIGDSRAYLYRAGSMTLLSQDHTEAALFASIFSGESESVLGRQNRLTQYLGVPESNFIIEPYISEWTDLQPHDILLICSDGLTHMTDDNSICEVLSGNGTLCSKRDGLLDLALKKGGLDNTTLILSEVLDE